MNDLDIPFTINLAEGDIRMQKVKQKISVALDQNSVPMCLHSFVPISTARKQGHPTLSAIHTGMVNKPLELA